MFSNVLLSLKQDLVRTRSLLLFFIVTGLRNQKIRPTDYPRNRFYHTIFSSFSPDEMQEYDRKIYENALMKTEENGWKNAKYFGRALRAERSYTAIF